MGTLVATTFTSLNGVMEAPGGEPGHPHAGWTMDAMGPEGYAYKLAETLASEALLLGRRTYEGFAEAWPGRDDPDGFAAKFNAMPKHVVSSTLTEPLAWEGSSVLPGHVAESVPALRERTAGEVAVHGSGTLLHALLEARLLDELRLMVFPVVIAPGRTWYPTRSERLGYELNDVRRLDAGIVLLTYRPA